MSGDRDLEKEITTIYQLYYVDVYRFLICYSGSRNDAEDLTQEVFIRVLNKLSEKQHIRYIKTWIFAIAKHVAIDHHRRNKISRLSLAHIFKSSVFSERDPSEYVEECEQNRLVHAAISKLKPHHKAVIILRGIK